MEIFITFAGAIFLSFVALVINAKCGNPADISAKKMRKIAIVAPVILVISFQISVNLFYACDSTHCGYTWGDPILKNK